MLLEKKMNEFKLIEKFFRKNSLLTNSNEIFKNKTFIGIGDDASVFSPPHGFDLVVSSDLLIEGTHFKKDHPPESIGHKVLAVNLSDIAAMGAELQRCRPLLRQGRTALSGAWPRRCGSHRAPTAERFQRSTEAGGALLAGIAQLPRASGCSAL